MGTRSLIHFLDQTETVLVTIYQHWDGYPGVVGLVLAKFLESAEMVKGIPIGRKPGPIANGAGCLAAQFIAQHKTSPGGLYIYPPKSEDVGEEYTYYVRWDSDFPAQITVTDYRGQILFNRGGVAEFLAFCESSEE